MADLIVIVERRFPGGWKELAQFIKANIPRYQCKHYAKGVFSTPCGYDNTDPGCRDEHGSVDNAIGLVKVTFGISKDEAKDIVYALRDVGWVRIWKCNRIVFRV
jgi:hypothetical protein